MKESSINYLPVVKADVVREKVTIERMLPSLLLLVENICEQAGFMAHFKLKSFYLRPLLFV